MDYLKLMREAKAKMEALLDLAKKENRAFTDEETTKWNAAQTDFDNAKAMADREAQLAKSASALNTPAPEPAPAPRVDLKPAAKWKGGLGEMLQAVARATLNPINTDPRLVRAQLGASEGVPSEGGFLVEPEQSPILVKRTYELAQISSRCRKSPVSGNTVKVNYIAETSRATGSRMGGVQGYWINEAGTITASQPALGQMEFKLKKLAGLMYATEELLADASGLQAFATEAYAEEFAWLLDNAVMNGTGAGQPMGVSSAACTVNVAKETGQAATTIVYENIVKMWARLWARSRPNSVWFINQDCEPQLQTMALVVGAGGVPVYMPAGGVASSPFATLMGRPIVPVEQCATCGTVGDIVLADMSQYQLIDKTGIQMAESIHVAFLTDQRAFRFIYRVDGQPIWASALTPANGTNTLSPFIRLATRV